MTNPHPLPAELAEIRGQLVQYVLAAYGKVAGRSYDNFALWLNVRAHVINNLERIYKAHGLEAPPWNWLALFRRAGAWAPTADANAHVAFIEALCTDFHDKFWEHIHYRLAHDGNLHLEFTGPTGSGKSSCAVGVANAIHAIQPEALLDHLSFDLTDLPKKLRGKAARMTVIQDEFVQTAGEGARTAQSLFQNLEDTLRASQVNLFICSPRRQDHATMQAQLEAICWDPKRKYTVFLVWIEGQPYGVIALPWMPAPLFEAYSAWKNANVQRSLAGQFKDRSLTAQAAIRAFADARVTEFLLAISGKPKKSDFEDALEYFHPDMLAASQVERIARFMWKMCYGWKKNEGSFQRWFGVQANEGMLAVARKCYGERKQGA